MSSIKAVRPEDLTELSDERIGKINDDSTVRIWSNELRIKEEAIEIQQYRAKYYEKKIKIKSL